MAGARVPWWGQVVKKLLQPDRLFILVTDVGTSTKEEGSSHLWNPKLKGPCSAVATNHGTFHRSQKRKSLQRRRQAEGTCQQGVTMFPRGEAEGLTSASQQFMGI